MREGLQVYEGGATSTADERAQSIRRRAAAIRQTRKVIRHGLEQARVQASYGSSRRDLQALRWLRQCNRLAVILEGNKEELRKLKAESRPRLAVVQCSAN